MADRIDDPLRGQPPGRVQLADAPLIRVLAQVQFAKVMKIASEQHIGDFQEAVRKDFPYIERDVAQSIRLDFDGPDVRGAKTEEMIWRLFDTTKQWRVSLNTSALTLETFRYTSRQKFLDRFRFLISALAVKIQPTIATRVGFRYVNRLDQPQDILDLEKLVYSDLVGLLSAPLRDKVELTISQAQCETREGRLLVRWGLLPAGATHDPDMAPPVNARSWMLDIDSFTTNELASDEFHPDELIGKVDMMANRAYAFFRWSVTPEFLTRFGGA
ncbi:MAG: TIGR04255 family protein [Rhodospirillales bacterium]|nr:MAG: TIGR04255 family protein [Rhodospirillales bacterium]